MQPKFSIILPVFNEEIYVKIAIESLLVQSFSNWELIAVNDASTDSSLCILRDFAQKDSRIELIEFKKNRGQGYARNYAIEKANGDYILFLDADDILAVDALAVLQERITNKPDTEVFAWGYQTKMPNKKNEKKYLPSKPSKEKGETPFQLGMLGRKGFNVFPWVYVIKKPLLLKYNIRFAEGIYFEDVQFSTRLLFYAQKVNIIKEVCYYYRKHTNSVTGRSSKQKIDDKFTAFLGIKTFLQEQAVFQQFQGLYLARFLALCVHTSFNEYFVLPKTELDKELDAYMLNIRKSKLLRKENLLLLRNIGLRLPKNEKAARRAYLGAYYGLRAIKNRYYVQRFLVRIMTWVYRKRKGLNQ